MYTLANIFVCLSILVNFEWALKLRMQVISTNPLSLTPCQAMLCFEVLISPSPVLVPSAIQDVEDVEVTIGNNASLDCRASGHDDLTYAWGRINSDMLFLFEPFLACSQGRVSGVNTSTLSFTNVSRCDAMMYGCTVSLFGELVGTRSGTLTAQGTLHTLLL